MRNAIDIMDGMKSLTVCVPDHFGRLIGKRRQASEWPDVSARGMAMPDFHLITGVHNRPLDGFDVSGRAHGFRNGRLRPDPAAAFVSPLETSTIGVISDVFTEDGKTVAEAPRSILVAQIKRLKDRGIKAIFASELEFYAFSESFPQVHASGYSNPAPIYHRHGDNDVIVAGLAKGFCDRIETALIDCGILVDQIQGEGGVGQFEINIQPAPVLEAADNHVVFKHVVKAAGHAGGNAVTFLSKPVQGDAGSGGHIHLSLSDEDGKNLLGEGQELSDFGRSFVAGLIAHTPELTLMHAPYVNSYRRLVPGSFTPLHATWAWDNRTAMVRLLTGGTGPRIEFRLPGADVNPYHAYAAILAAGLAGVENRMTLGEAKNGGRDPDRERDIPADLAEAHRRFRASDLAAQAFGPAIRKHIATHAACELDDSRRAVTDWEISRGFEHA